MKSPGLIPVIVASALFMEFLDQTIVITALPAIAEDIGANAIHLGLGLSSYFLSLALFTPASGWIADRFGARRVFQLALIVFTAGSIGCGSASSLESLVAARLVQGIGGAMLMPVGRLIVLGNVPRGEMVAALTWLTLPAVIGPMLGPVVGGFIATYFNWRWIFLINVPLGILGIALATIYFPDIRAERSRPFDIAGFVLTSGGFAAFGIGSTALSLGSVWREIGVLLMVMGATFLALYARHATRAASPILNISLFRLPTFRASMVAGVQFRIANGAGHFLLPLLFQFGFGMTALQSGLLTFGSGVSALFMKATTGPILRQFGFRRALMGNGLITAAFLAGCAAFTPATPVNLILVILLTWGFFRSLQYTSITALSFAEVEPEAMSSATSITSMAQPLAQSLGISIAAVVLQTSIAWRSGTELVAGDFPPAFLTVGVLGVVSALFFAMLPRQAGSEMSGHHRNAAAPPSTAAPLPDRKACDPAIDGVPADTRQLSPSERS
jgi:EmrB/QacA subfamily drug resistance transporter